MAERSNDVTQERKKKKKDKSLVAEQPTATIVTPSSTEADAAKQEKRRKKKEKKSLLQQQQQQQAQQHVVTEEEKKKKKEDKRRQKAATQPAPAQPQDDAEKKKEKKRRKKEAALKANEAKEPAPLTATITNGTAAKTENKTSGTGGFYIEHSEIASMTKQQVEDYRKELNITVSDGDSHIRPIKTFDQAGFPLSVRKCVSKFEKPSAIQAQCWPALLTGRDVVGIAKTGSGKTLGFMLPAYVKILDLISKNQAKKGPLCLVLAPTRELALQSAKVCNDMEADTQVKTVCIYGGVDAREQVTGIQQGARVVIATPGRLIGLINDKKLSLSNVIYAVLDEADRMLDMGFEPDVRAIMEQVSKTRQTLLFSATWPTSVQKLGSEFVNNPFHVLVGSEQLTANHDVAQIVEVVEDNPSVKDKRLLAVMKQYHNKQLQNRILVFVLYKKDVPRIENLLSKNGYSCGSISSDRSQADRIRALEGFRDGSKPILVGTDVASRGLDIPDVSHVINYSFPLTIEDYIHRIGRTGRSGKKGVSHTLFCKFDKGLAGELVNVLNEAKAEVPSDLIKFGTGVKRKEHGMYGLHYKSTGDAPMPASKKVVFS